LAERRFEMAQAVEEPRLRGLDRLRRLRDELRVQVALAKAETRSRWERLEDRWDDLEERLDRIEEASEDAAEDIRESAGRLVHEIGQGYERIKEALGREAPKIPGLERAARLRDELRLKLALGKAEAKAEWERLEDRWEDLRNRLSGVEEASSETATELRKAAGSLLEEIAEGYERIRKAL
jgi:hypothetical protein